MPSLPDTAVIILLGLLLFGPKGLAKIARQLGKLMGEFRRASNEFRMQMEEELRISEQVDRQKEIAAVEAAAPVTPALPHVMPDNYGEDHPHLPSAPTLSSDAASSAEGTAAPHEPLPIASSGDLSLMPPATGLPEPRASSSLSALIDAVPKIDGPGLAVDGAAVNGDPSGSHSSSLDHSSQDHEDQPHARYHEHDGIGLNGNGLNGNGLNGNEQNGSGLNGAGHTVAAEESLHG